MHDPGLVLHECCFYSVGTREIVPRPEASLLFSFDKGVSANSSISRGDILFFSFSVALEPEGVLVMNGDEVLGTFGGGGEGLRASWTGGSPG